MSNQMKFSCPNCDSENIDIENRPGGWFRCQDCHHSWQPSPIRFGFAPLPRKPTVFETITTSPEVLAEKLVYEAITCDGDGHVLSGYRSTITKGFWLSELEAIAATVEKLKEVER